MESTVKKLIKQGEGLKVEFKECHHKLSKDVYETVCAFLNQIGGEILLGVTDKGLVQGVLPDCIEQIKKDFVNGINNSSKINPPMCLGIEEVLIDDKTVVYIVVPEGSQVHRCNGRIYLRNKDADQDVTDNQTIVSQLYARKQNTYSENKIYQYVTIADLRTDLIAKVRKIASIQKTDHPWADMDDLELLKSASLYYKDYSANQEGFTLAAVLLFGKDDVISSILPHYKTDLIIRIKNIDRYDDRDIVCTNLIESYDRIMAFIEKHLPSPFYLEKDMRIDLRSAIFREIATNMLIHREYLNPSPARLIIEKDKIFTENSNKPYINGIINLNNLMPHPKNPNIAKVFRQIGRAEELGSGVKKLYKYCKIYTSFDPIISDEHLFKLTLPHKLFLKTSKVKSDKVSDQDKPNKNKHFEVSDQAGIQDKIVSDQDKPNKGKRFEVSDQASVQDKIVSDQAAIYHIENSIIDFCTEPKTLKEIMMFLNYKHKTNFRKNIFKPLLDKGVIKPTIPKKPTSPNQKYISCIKK